MLVPSLPSYGDYECIDGDRLEVVRRCFEYTAYKPWSIKKTAGTLTNMGLTMYGHAVTPQALQKLIVNEKYMGDYAYGKTLGAKYKTCTNGAVNQGVLRRSQRGRCHTGVFLDAPYSERACDSAYLYRHGGVWEEVVSWCQQHGDRPDLRIALCGYAGTCDLERHGWSVYNWTNSRGAKGKRGLERIWFNRSCLNGTPVRGREK
jgi:hypothetical protein